MKKSLLLIVCVLGITLLLSGCGKEQGSKAASGNKDSILETNITHLKLIGLSCKIYANIHDKFPPNLNAMITDEIIEDKNTCLWTNPANGKKIPFIYCAGLTEASKDDLMLAAAPESVDGQREVLYVDGSAKRVSESVFAENAKKQSWKLP